MRCDASQSNLLNYLYTAGKMAAIPGDISTPNIHKYFEMLLFTDPEKANGLLTDAAGVKPI